MKKTVSNYSLCILMIFTALSCQKQSNVADGTNFLYTIQIQFKPVVGQNTLEFENPYSNAFNEDFTVKTFRFYVANTSLYSNSQLIPTEHETKYRLVDHAVESSKILSLTTLQPDFTHFEFQLGVDSIDNVSGAQAGSLDPAKGMFWTWNSGYVMAKLEGASGYSTMPDGSFSYHIGGFSGVSNTVKTIRLATPVAVELSPNRTTTLVVEADIAKWFKGVHDLPIATNSFVHSPGDMAKRYADNYADMFRITGVITE